MGLLVSSGLCEGCLHCHRVAGKRHTGMGQEKILVEMGTFSHSRNVYKVLMCKGDSSFSKNYLAYFCSLRIHFLSALEYSEHVFPFDMRRKFPLKPKVSLLLLI